MIIYGLQQVKRFYTEKAVLDKVDLTIEKGKTYALVGENGTGKTTLLETLALLEAPQEGTVFFESEKVDFERDLTLLRQKISFCMQRPVLFRLSVFDNIAYGLKVRGLKKENIKEKVTSISTVFGLSHLLAKKALSLSGGEAQKVALARSFVLETPIILLDEPTANLDEASIRILEDLLSEVKEKGRTVVLATHQLDSAFRLADAVITLKDGQVFPHSYQNFFSGEILQGEGLKTFRINEDVLFIVLTDKLGKAKVSIDPKEIIISKEPLRSSARNCLRGRVLSIIDEGQKIKLTAHCGVRLVAQITYDSLRELGLNPGDEIFLTFKTSSIKIY